MIQKFTIGRNPGNNIVVNHPNVSGYHADLILNDTAGYTQYSFADHSTNGTYINGQFLHNATCFVAFNDQVLLSGQAMLDWNAVASLIGSVQNTVIGQPYQQPYQQPFQQPFQQQYQQPYQQPYQQQAAFMQQPDSGNNAMNGSGHYNVSSGRISFIGALKSFFVKYVDFSGRATRREYWYMVLWMLIFSCILDLLAIPAVLSASISVYDLFDLSGALSSVAWFVVLYGIYDLVIFIPSLSLLVRRIHDTGKSGLWALMLLVPLANFVFVLIWIFSPSEPRTNRWGRYIS